MILPVQDEMLVTYFHCMGREWIWNCVLYQKVVLKIALEIFFKGGEDGGRWESVTEEGKRECVVGVCVRDN